MLYKTHKAGGTLFMLAGFKYLESKGMLLPDVNPIVQLMIMYPASSWGSTAPDLDHHIGSVKEITPFNLLVHKVLHLTKPKHRSWQTHSVLVTGGLCLLFFSISVLLFALFGNTVENVYIRLNIVGGCLGVMSHLVMDSLTTAGIHIWPGMKFKLVPSTKEFATGTTWENFIFKITMIANAFLLLDIILNVFGTSISGLAHIVMTYY